MISREEAADRLLYLSEKTWSETNKEVFWMGADALRHLVPKKANSIHTVANSRLGTCPECGFTVVAPYGCPDCLQKIDWSEGE